MKKHLKKYFIPHKENDHKPHFLRKESLAFLFAALVVLEGAFLLGSFTVFKNGNFLAAVLPGTLVSLTNENRVAYNVGQLKENPLLVQAAKLKAADMAAKGYFAHTSPDGKTPWYWLDLAGYSYLYAGENLAVNFTDSKDVSDAWMRSPAHKENIVNGRYTEIGIATAQGMYKGQEVTFVVEFFGDPAAVSNSNWLATLVDKTKTGNGKPAAVSNVSNPQKNPPKNIPQTAPLVQTKPTTPPEPVVLAEESSFESDQDNQPGFMGSMEEIKGENTPIRQEKPLLKVLESPRATIAVALMALIILLSVALALAVLIKIKIQHPRMIAGTLVVIFIALGILYFNSEVFRSITEVPIDINYASIINAF